MGKIGVTAVRGVTWGTAYTIVNVGLETAPAASHILYVCNHEINIATFSAYANPAATKLYYSVPVLCPRFGVGNAFYDALRAVYLESDFWHTGTSIPANRLAKDAINWYVKPSVSLSNRLAAFFLANTDPFFVGTMADECTANIQDAWWTAWKTTGEVVEGDRAAQEVIWDAAVAAYFAALKTAGRSNICVIANSGGATYAGIDGITIEDVWIGTDPGELTESQALQKFVDQRAFWVASSNRFGAYPHSVMWNYSLSAPMIVMAGTSVF